ncbi:MAG: hypothetical protein AAF961_01980, partial [Planctomycetota bacterium]
ATDDAKHLLRYRFEMGEVLRYRVRHATNVRTTIDGTTQQVESQSESIKAWKVTDVLPSGDMEFVHMVEQVKMSNRMPGGQVNEFDSQNDQSPPPTFAKAAAAVGVPLSVLRIEPDGAVARREQKHPQPPASDDMPITLVLPAEPIAVGDKWDAVYEVPAQRKSKASIKVRTRRLCRLTAVKSGVAVIEVDYQILTPIDSYVRSQLLERLTSGVVRFDIERGRIITQRHNVDDRVLGFAGQASSVHFVARTQERLIDDDSVLISARGPAR